nr:hypothetical protein [Tanacetum cinerariifolium]
MKEKGPGQLLLRKTTNTTHGDEDKFLQKSIKLLSNSPFCKSQLFANCYEHVPSFSGHSGGAGAFKGLPSRTISLLWQVEPNVAINDARSARDSHDS